MALIAAGVLAGLVSGVVILLVWMERKIIARMQDRYASFLAWTLRHRGARHAHEHGSHHHCLEFDHCISPAPVR